MKGSPRTSGMYILLCYDYEIKPAGRTREWTESTRTSEVETNVAKECGSWERTTRSKSPLDPYFQFKDADEVEVRRRRKKEGMETTDGGDCRPRGQPPARLRPPLNPAVHSSSGEEAVTRMQRRNACAHPRARLSALIRRIG